MTDVLCIGELLIEFVADTNNVSLTRSPDFTPSRDSATATLAGAPPGALMKPGERVRETLFVSATNSMRSSPMHKTSVIILPPSLTQ